MANTEKLKLDVEDYVRGWLAQKYNKEFENSDVSLKLLTGGRHRFDVVSKDHKIIGDIKSNAPREDAKVGAGPIRSAFLDLYYLSLVDAKEKLLIFTNEAFFEIFERRSKGKVLPDTKILFCPLPSELGKEVLKVNKESRNEIKKRG